MHEPTQLLRRNNKTSWAGVLVLMALIWSALVAGSLVWDMHQLKQDTLNAATAAERPELWNTL